MVLDQLLAVFVLATFASAVDVKGTVAVRQKLHDRLDSLEASLREARETPSALDSATGSPDGDHSPAGLADSTAYTSGVMHRAHPHSPTALRHDATAFPHTMRGTAKTTGEEPKPAYVILGGSNTLGAKNVKHVPGRPWVSYAVQLAARDGWAANYSRVQNAQGAMGPTMAAGCATSFIPPSARLVTIEYLPNMGYSGDDKSELAAIATLLQVAQQRRARTLVILINPGRERFETMAAGCTGDDMVGCTTTEHSHHLRDGMLNLARQYGARSVLADCDTDRNLFGEDAMHLNQEGHNLVHSKILEHLRNWPEPPPPPVQSRPDMGVLCALGEELRQLVAESHGFTEIDMARPEQGAPKIGWESREPGGNVTLCATLPREQMKREIALKETKKYYNSKERKTELGKYMMAVSHALNLPLFGRFSVSCRGACECECMYSEHQPAINCSWNTLTKGRATVTQFFRLFVTDVLIDRTADDPPLDSKPCGRGQCAITIRNAEVGAASIPPTSNVGFRVILRALILGISDSRTSWLNTYRLDSSGIRNVRMLR